MSGLSIFVFRLTLLGHPLGVSPRGTLALQRATQALAFLLGRDYAIPDDVKFLAPHVLCHRLILTGGRRGRTAIERLLRAVPIP